MIRRLQTRGADPGGTSGRLARVLPLVALLIACPALASAQAPAGADATSDASVQIGGSVRTVAAAVQGSALEPPDSAGDGGFDETLLRLTLEAQPADRVSVELHVVQSYAYSSTGAGGGLASAGVFGLVPAETRYRTLDATADWYRSARQAASLWVDRLNVTLRLPRADVTIGRQAITFGKTYFWNPLDEFLPFDARQFDRDYKAGVDAVRIDVPTGSFSGVNLVAAPGRELAATGAYRGGKAALGASWYGSALLGRYFTTLRGWDVAVQGGKVYGGYQIGGGATGEIAGLELRGEAAYLSASPGLPLPAPLPGRLIEDHLAAVVGVGKRLPNTLTIEAEHFHNGAGSADLDAGLVRIATGAALQLGREITGVTVGYDLLPVLTAQAAVLHSWSDQSTLFQPTLTYSVSSNSDLLAGVAVGAGTSPAAIAATAVRLRSEFGSFPRAAFAEYKLYF